MVSELAKVLPRLLVEADALECGGDVPADVGEDVAVLLVEADVLRVGLDGEHAERPPFDAQRNADPVERVRTDLVDLTRLDQAPRTRPDRRAQA